MSKAGRIRKFTRWFEEAGMSRGPAVSRALVALVALHSSGAVLPVPHASCSALGVQWGWSVLLDDGPFSWRSRTEGQSYGVWRLLSWLLCGNGNMMGAGWEEAMLEKD